MSSSNCCFLTCIQISQEAGKVVLYSHFLKNFPQSVVIHTVKDFSIVNEAEVDVLLEFSCFFYDPADVGNLISGSSAFSKSSLNIWKFSVHELFKPSLENCEHYFGCALVCTRLLQGHWTTAPGLHYCFLTAPPCLCSCALPGLDSCLNLLFETQGRGHRQASVLRSPMGSCLVSFSLSWLPLRREEFPLFSHICKIIPLIFQWSWLL